MEEFSGRLEDKYRPQINKYEPQIQHLPNKSTGNLEDSFLPPYPDFSKNTLIYGASGEEHDGTPRDELVEVINVSRDIPLVADVFLYNFDTSSKDEYDEKDNIRNFEPFNNETKNFIKEVIENDGQVSDSVIKELLKIKNHSYDDIHYFNSDRVNINSEKEIIQELLQDINFKNNIKELYDLSEKLSSLKYQLENKELSTYNRTYIERQADNVIDRIYEVFPQINLAKTKKILDKVLENNGKIYFSLDGIATSRDKEGKLILDRNKLNDLLFNKNSKYYYTMTSDELRHIYNNHLDKPGLKFLIDSQVISTPIPKR